MDDEEDRIGTTVLVPLLSVGPVATAGCRNVANKQNVMEHVLIIAKLVCYVLCFEQTGFETKFGIV